MTFPIPKADDWRGWNWPVPIWNRREPVPTDTFQMVATPEHRFHPGIDIMFRREQSDPGFPFSSPHYSSQGASTPIIAAGSGTIWDVGRGRPFQIAIDHGVIGGRGVVTWYQHLASFSEPWRKGDPVRAGEVLGLMGGDSKVGGYPLYHLHFELWFPLKGTKAKTWKANPLPYMKFWKKIALPRTGEV